MNNLAHFLVLVTQESSDRMLKLINEFIIINAMNVMSIFIAGGCVDVCHSFATCQNINGTYTCVCNSGFIGNGTFCEGK